MDLLTWQIAYFGSDFTAESQVHHDAASKANLRPAAGKGPAEALARYRQQSPTGICELQSLSWILVLNCAFLPPLVGDRSW